MVSHHDDSAGHPFPANKADFDFPTFIDSRDDTGDAAVEKVDPFDVLGLVFQHGTSGQVDPLQFVAQQIKIGRR
jgi:hypothetical protein